MMEPFAKKRGTGHGVLLVLPVNKQNIETCKETAQLSTFSDLVLGSQT